MSVDEKNRNRNIEKLFGVEFLFLSRFESETRIENWLVPQFRERMKLEK